jgi:hypothetical protein
MLNSSGAGAKWRYADRKRAHGLMMCQVLPRSQSFGRYDGSMDKSERLAEAS